MKKLVTTVLLAITCAASAFAAGFVVDGIYYNLLANGTVEVTYQSYSSTNNYSNLESSDIIIPAYVTYGGTDLKVVKIGELAFKYASNITSVEIPNTVTQIEKEAFSSCSKLQKITLPNSILSIGDGALSYTKLDSITFPNSITSLGESVLRSCRSLTYAKLPTEITSIPAQMFLDCDSLTSLNDIFIPENIQSIGDYAFLSCDNLCEANVPQSIRVIGKGAFTECKSFHQFHFRSN